jgi:hypothetical protein
LCAPPCRLWCRLNGDGDAVKDRGIGLDMPAQVINGGWFGEGGLHPAALFPPAVAHATVFLPLALAHAAIFPSTIERAVWQRSTKTKQRPQHVLLFLDDWLLVCWGTPRVRFWWI